MRSLRHNHLISPDKYPDTKSHQSELRRLVPAYARVSDYLASISRNSYGAGTSYEVERVKEMLSEISRYRCIGDDNVYSIVVSDPES
jgi:hypothetical protein